MHETVRLGRIAGIRVGTHWSLLVVFWLITLGLATRLSTDHPGYTQGTYWVAALAGALVFYGALLAHELGHAVTARRQGIPVEGVTLWLFGGVTRMRGEPTSPGGTLRVALVGPLVSLAAAATFGVLALALDGLGAPALVEGTARWLARINLLLAAFNLVPAAPLDGGRVLQALLWWRRGDRWSASAAAAQAGHAFGYLLLGLGLLDVVVGIGTGGLWFAFLGWFLVLAARAEQASNEARRLLEGIPVAEVMTPNPVAAPGWITVETFLEDYVRRHRLSTFPVERFDGSLAGVVTLKALEHVPRPERRAVRVADVSVGTDRVPVARPDEMVLDLLDRMGPDSAGPALVIDDGRLVGMVSPADVARALEVGGILKSGGGRGVARRLSP